MIRDAFQNLFIIRAVPSAALRMVSTAPGSKTSCVQPAPRSFCSIYVLPSSLEKPSMVVIHDQPLPERFMDGQL